MVYTVVKRLFDFLCALIGLILLTPLFLIIAILVKLDSKGPVLFKQERIGQFRKPFTIYKFRTMVDNAHEKGPLVSSSDDARTTSLGRFLRKHKLDELPQLFNVLTGSMSLVGPRPEVSRYIESYRDDYNEILQVKPGITDVASIKFRNENDILRKSTEPEEYYLREILPIKIAYNKFYLSKRSIWFDLLIILRTLFLVVTRQ